MQTILGASGTIGNPLAAELAKTNPAIRLVSRKPKKVNETDELLAADLTVADEVKKAIAGSDIVYVTIGFEYSAKKWRQLWPPFMHQVIAACKAENAKLVFFDNMYMYDHEALGHMTEETKINPQTEKGKVRAELVDMIMDAVNNGEIQAIIARAADFIGGRNSVIVETVLSNYKNGKSANWLISANAKHNYTYTLDAARAVAELGNGTDEVWNQTWHLPSTEARTGKEWADLAAKIAGVKPKLMVLSPFFLRILGVFMPVMKEVREMSYQWKNDYFFDSSKFEKHFAWKAKNGEQALKEVYSTL